VIPAQIDWIDQAGARQRLAQQQLQRMVDERRQSFDVADYRRRRAAALKGRAAA
jgi:hypothetical protein